MPRQRGEVTANLHKAREAALLAVETYNRPGTAFRSAGYIVLMIVAWTGLFHAIFFKRRIKPFYRKKNSRRFERVNGDYKAWELGECLRQFYKDQNPAPRKNLEFFIGLRNKIEHRFLPELDLEIFGECQARRPGRCLVAAPVTMAPGRGATSSLSAPAFAEKDFSTSFASNSVTVQHIRRVKIR